jgi:ATP-binding cassette, subfamily B, bacterial PglK
MLSTGSAALIETFRRISRILNAAERRRALLLLAMMIVMGLLEATGVASVMPFFAVVSNPEVARSNAYLNAVYEGFGFTSVAGFMLALGGVVFVLVVGSLAFRALTQWAMARFVQMRGYSLSCRLLNCYLARPYSYFLNRHSADLGKSVLFEAHQVVTGLLLPAAQLVANSITAAFLFAVMLVSSPAVALGALALLGGGYGLVYLAVRGYVGRIGEERVRSNRDRFQIAQEALAGIKDVKVLGLEGGFLRSFRKPAMAFARSQATNQIVGQLPQYVLQALAVGGLIGFLLVMLALRNGNITELLPIMALYAFAGLRLLPALQQVYQALTRMRYGRAALDSLYDDLVEGKSIPLQDQVAVAAADAPVIRLREALLLDNVSYSYPEAEGASVRDLTLTIPVRTTVGFVGSTGAGKTTVVDLVLGLLEPQQGRLLVDGAMVKPEERRSWQRNIGYVPQHIFLSDDTIAANIAFGVPPAAVDAEAVERAARIADLHDFVVRETARGYDTVVGERGVRLSGGQRQRIGIARALYHDPDVLVLDEATSALDNLTEKAVMDAMHNMGGRKTIIMIAHRLSTVRSCDTIFMLENGRLKASGTYQSLLDSDSGFRSMASV